MDANESFDVHTGSRTTVFRDQPIVEEATDQPTQHGENQGEIPPSHDHPPAVPGSASQGTRSTISPDPVSTPAQSLEAAPSPHSVNQTQMSVAKEHEADQSAASNLVPHDKVSQATSAVSMRDFSGCDDPDILPCTRHAVEQLAALLNQLAGKFPDMEGRDLARALGIANNKILVAMNYPPEVPNHVLQRTGTGGRASSVLCA